MDKEIQMQGTIMPVLDIIKHHFEGSSVLEKLNVLSFGKMNVDGPWCYDHGLDQILGPHRNVQVVMARGLIKNWKEPMYYEFDNAVSGTILMDII